MEISSVGVTAYTQTSVQNQRTQETQQARQVEQQVVQTQAREESEPKPVRNAEGQMTGGTVNTTA